MAPFLAHPVHVRLLSLVCLLQHYFADPWNVLDFVIVVGSIIDIVIEFLLVSFAILRILLMMIG